MGCHFLLQEILPTQGLNQGPPHCRQTLYPLSHQGSLFKASQRPRQFQKVKPRSSLVTQWLRLRPLNARCLGSVPGRGTGSHMPQLQVHTPQFKTEYHNEDQRSCMPQLRPSTAKEINIFLKWSQICVSYGRITFLRQELGGPPFFIFIFWHQKQFVLRYSWSSMLW